MNLNARLSALAAVGVGRTGLGVADGADGLEVGEGATEADGEDCAVEVEPAQPDTTNAAASRTVRVRMLPEV